MRFIVDVEMDDAEVDKLNRKAKRVGRAETSAKDIVENNIADSLKHDFRIKTFSITAHEGE